MWECVQVGALVTRSKTLLVMSLRWSALSLTSRFSSLSSLSSWLSSRVSHTVQLSLSNCIYKKWIYIHVYVIHNMCIICTKTQTCTIYCIHHVWAEYIWWIFHVVLEKRKKGICLTPPESSCFTDTCHLDTSTAMHMRTCAQTDIRTNTIIFFFFFFRLDNWCLWGASWPAGAGERGYGGAISHLLSHTQTLTLECTHTWSQKSALLTCTLQTIWVHVQVCYQGCAVCNAGSDLGTKTIEGYIYSKYLILLSEVMSYYRACWLICPSHIYSRSL